MADNESDASLMEDGEDSTLIFEPNARRKKKSKMSKVKSKLKSLDNSRLLHNASMNSSLVKHTLRSNNRALAKALEVSKQELGISQQTVLQLQEEKQDLHLQVVTLNRVAGLKDQEIENEVEDRMKNRLTNIKGVLQQVSNNLLSTVELLQEGMSLCGKDRGRNSSLASSRISSLGSSRNQSIECPQPQRSIYQQAPVVSKAVPKTSQVVEPESPLETNEKSNKEETEEDTVEDLGSDIVEELGDINDAIAAMAHPVTDLSVIMERSHIFDDLPFTDDSDKPEKIIEEQAETNDKPEDDAPAEKVSKRTSKRRSELIQKAPATLVTDITKEASKNSRRVTRSRSRSRQRLTQPVVQEPENERPEETEKCASKDENSDTSSKKNPPKKVQSESEDEEEKTSRTRGRRRTRQSHDQHLKVNAKSTVSRSPTPDMKRNRHASGYISESDVDRVFKPRCEIPRSPVSNPNSRQGSLEPEESVRVSLGRRSLPIPTLRAKENGEGGEEVKNNVPKWISLEANEKGTDQKDRRISSGKNKRVSTSSKRASIGQIPQRRSISKTQEKEKNTNEKETQNEKNDKNEEEEEKEVSDSQNTNDVDAESSEDKTVSKKQRRGTFVLPKQQQKQTKETAGNEAKGRRGTFVVPKSPPLKKTSKEAKNKRETFVVPTSLPLMSAKTLQEKGKKDEQLDGEEDDILNESASILVASEEEVDNVQEEFSGGGPDKTVFMNEDMDFTEAISSTHIAQLLASQPQPGQVSRPTPEHFMDTASQDSLLRSIINSSQAEATSKLMAKIKRGSVDPPFLNAGTTEREDGNRNEGVEPNEVEEVVERVQDSCEEDDEEEKAGLEEQEKVSEAASLGSESESSSEKSNRDKKRSKLSMKNNKKKQAAVARNGKEKKGKCEESNDESDIVSDNDVAKDDSETVESEVNHETAESTVEDEDQVEDIPAEDEDTESEEEIVRKTKSSKKQKKAKPNKRNRLISTEDEEIEEMDKNEGEGNAISDQDSESQVHSEPVANKEKLRKNTYVVDSEEEQVPSGGRARSKRRAKSVVQSYAEESFRDESMMVEPPAEKHSKDDAEEKESEDMSDMKKKFNTFFSKPGKITFKAGRIDASDLMANKGKYHSMLPKEKTRSKPRSKQPKPVPDFKAPEPVKDPGQPKSVFDLSLNESVNIMPSQTNFSDYRSISQDIETSRAQHKLIKSKTQPDKSSKDDSSPTGTVSKGETSIVESPHGIMLVLGNGKRTKPRKNKVKAVSYACKLSDVHLTTPRSQADDDALVTPPSGVVQEKKNRVMDAGITPPRMSLEKSADPQSPPPPGPDVETVIPDTPVVAESNSEERKRRRTVETENTPPSKRPSLDEEKEETKPSKPSKLSLNKASQKEGKIKEPLTKMQALRQKLQQQNQKRVQAAQQEEKQQVQSQEGDHIQFFDDRPTMSATSKISAPVSRLTPPRIVISSSKDSDSKRKKQNEDIESNQKKTEASQNSKLSVDNGRKRSLKSKELRDEDEIECLKKVKEPKVKVQKDKVKSQVKSKDKKEVKKRSSVLVAPPPLTDDEDENLASETGKRQEDSEKVVRRISEPKTNSRLSRVSLDSKRESTDSVGMEDSGRRSRRAGASVSYKEPAMNRKMRQGDPGSSSIYSGPDAPKVKPKKGKGSTGTGGRSRSSGKRAALTDVNE